MKEFIFFIRKQTDSRFNLLAEKHLQFLKGCEYYMARLKKEKRLISAQPIESAGKIVAKQAGVFTESLFNESPRSNWRLLSYSCQ